jgi:AAA domain
MIQVRYSDDVVLNGIKVLLYGKPGVGKTPFLATAPAPIIISAEQGLLSVSKLHVPYIKIDNYRDLTEAFTWCMQSQEAKQYWTFGLDSMSEICEVLLTERKRTQKDPRKAYGDVADEGLSVARYFRDNLPGKNVVVVCKEEFDKDEQTGAMLYQPMMPGKQLGPKLPYFFDEVWRMISGEQGNQRFTALCTRGNYQFVARDRSGMLADFEQPNATNVFRKILGI